jgi:electron transport complex protein RnfG
MSTPAPVERRKTSAWEMYRAIVGIGAFCAVLIVGVYKVTAPQIKINQERFLAAAVAEVLPAAKITQAVALDDNGALVTVEESGELPAFLGFDADGVLVGAALAAQDMGYQDIVRVLYAYTFEKKAITGMKVLESRETPGLGDKVEKEPHFLANFEALDARLAADGSGLANEIVTVKQGEKTQPWELDGITGATITSVAIGKILNDSAQVWVPVLEREARDIPAPKPPPEPPAEATEE